MAIAKYDGTDFLNLDALSAAVSIEYGRLNGATSYYFLRIPRYDLNGRRVSPKVALTSADGSVDGSKASALTFAKREHTSVAINAGLFNTNTKKPEGQLVIGGVDRTVYKTDAQTGDPYAWMDDDMGTAIGAHECYPLLIDGTGSLSCVSEDRTAAENQPAALIAAGYRYAVTGWGMLINNYTDDGLSTDEIVHQGAYIRQIIGQFQNGDYFVFCCDKTGYSGATAPQSHEAGASYADISAFLIGRGVKFAYSLDGGGSCETVLGSRQVNPIFDGTAGRAVPTVIYWSADE